MFFSTFAVLSIFGTLFAQEVRYASANIALDDDSMQLDLESGKTDSKDHWILSRLISKTSLREFQQPGKAIIVMGFQDSGKDILIKLVSGLKTVQSSSDLTAISDDIQTSSHDWYPIRTRDFGNTNSFYEFPKLVIPHKGNVVDPNDDIVKQDVISKFFESKVIENADGVKLLYVADYKSMLLGDEKAKFIALQMLTALQKYKGSVAMIVTNVDPNDENPKEKILKSLQKILSVETTSNFLNQDMIGLLWCTKKQDNYSLQSTKASLIDLIRNNTEYIRNVKYIDIINPLQQETTTRLCSFIKTIKKNISLNFQKLFKDIRKNFEVLNSESNDIFKLRAKFIHAHNVLSDITKSRSEFRRPEDIVDWISKEINALKLDVSEKPMEKIIKYYDVLKFFESFGNSCGSNNPPVNSIIKKFDERILSYLKNFETGYNLLIDLFNLDYDLIRMYHSDNKVDLRNKENLIHEAIQFIRNTKKDASVSKKFDMLLKFSDRETLENKLKLVLGYIYQEPEVHKNETINSLVVLGNYVFLSKVERQNQGKVEIYAREKFYVDSNYTGIKQLSVVAPIWEVVKDTHREISLIGSIGPLVEPKQWRYGSKSGEDGEPGLPGNPGGPGGNFFGMGIEFINGPLLTVSSIGGTGSSGQDAGWGSNGWVEYDRSVDTLKDNKNCNLMISGFDKWYNCSIEFKCMNGGHGGKGGSGGSGGEPGVVRVFSVGDRQTNVLSMEKRGSPGNDGQDGRAGKATTPGEVWKYIWVKQGFGYDYPKDKKISEGAKCADGIPGHATLEASKSTPAPGTPSPNFDPSISDVVIAFKEYARRQPNGVRDSFLRDFIRKIDFNSHVASLTENPLGFTNEFLSLESQFKPDKPYSFLEHYTSLRDRIEAYVQQKSNLSDDAKNVLNHMKAALMSKINAINLRSEDDLILDPEKELKEAVKEINKYNQQKSLLVIQDSFDRYDEIFRKKIEEAKGFIDGLVAKDLSETYIGIDGEVKTLLKEILELKVQTKEDQKKLKEKKDKLSNQLLLRGAFGIAKMGAGILSFLGPIGASTGAGVGASAAIIETVMFDDLSSLGQDKIAKLPSAVNAFVNSVKSKADDQSNIFNNKLEYAKEKLTKIKDEGSQEMKEAVKEIAKKMVSIKKEIKDATNPHQTLVQMMKAPEILNKKRAELVALMEKKVELIKTDEPSSKYNKNNWNMGVNKAMDIINLFDVGFTSLQTLKNDEEKLNKLTDEENKLKNDLKKLDDFEAKINGEFCKFLERILGDFKSKKKDMMYKTHGFLDVSRWQVGTTIRELRTQVTELTNGFKNQERFLGYVKRLEEGMIITIDLFARIEKYRDEVALASLLKNFNQLSIYPDISNYGTTPMQKRINALNVITLKNTIRKRYESVYHSFKQYVFPFAAFFLNDYNFHTSEDFNTLTNQAKIRIKDMETKLNLDQSRNKPYHTYVNNGYWFNDSSMQNTPPFYRWDYDTIENILPDLLSGKEVNLDADLSLGLPPDDAVKFDIVGIRFKLENSKLQENLNRVLDHYRLFATHHGNSHYRFCGQSYMISTPAQKLEIQTRPENRESPYLNTIATRLRNNYPLLSPYATWSFRLKFMGTDYGSDQLSGFANEPMSMELTGRGQYVDTSTNSSICDIDLKSFYRLTNHILL